MLKFLLKTAVAGAVIYAVTETLSRTNVAAKVTNLADAALTKVAGLVPTGFEKSEAESTEDKAYYYDTPGRP